MEELLLRIEAILRRVKGKKMKDIPFYKLGNFLFDTQKQNVGYRRQGYETYYEGMRIIKLVVRPCK